MYGLEARELECFLVLSEELHFGRAAERLYVSQGRVSQLLRALESRIGGRLLERSSRRVALTPLGERFVGELRPAYAALHEVVAGARDLARGVAGRLRVGFVGTPNRSLMGVLDAYALRYPDVEVGVDELALNDPFGPIRRGEVDAAFVCLPVAEPDLAVGRAFSGAPQVLAVSERHPLAARASVGAEDLAACAMVDIDEPAPAAWRELFAPTRTPGGLPIARGPRVRTFQAAMTTVAADRAAMVICHPSAQFNRGRGVAFVPIRDLPDTSLALVWPREAPGPRVLDLDRVVREAAPDCAL
ncbi:LysR family transcriptional regulator [Yinghuangia seranimata]|uniref:LysR family transcriptional regulator n=1 Tax=Yinghuangia seranimata TaxID=408067 RepID=UPI00248B5996|nr:LysR family transcriptional regulator [Yinghuangia seranimata]MDI2125238.1 LysR family transcriptional regulator [Yinghuangia seranimata]